MPVVKDAFITGVNGGIGKVLAQKFKAKGYHVIGTDIDYLVDKNSCDIFVQADLLQIVEDENYAEAFFGKVRRNIQGVGLTVLINNAAIQIIGSTTQLSRKDWLNTLKINVLAPFFFIQALEMELAKAQGSVINISSIHSTQSKPGFVAYATSKAALDALTRNIAVDIGRVLRINSICPAAIETSMLTDGFVDHEEGLAQLKEMHPIGRIGKPSEVAEVALFLASSAASFLTGAEISLDGGIRARLHDPV